MPKAVLGRAGGSLAAVLFDLDGTLVDSAPDLAGTVNDMRQARGLDPLPYGQLRVHAGSGARGMLGAAFGTRPDAPAYVEMRDEFHDRYEGRLLANTRLFDAVATVLESFDRHGLPWGIVTNKALRFAEPLARSLGLLPRALTLVGGDSTPHTKPHPEPLLEAARRLGQPPQACMFVGDDPRDVQAGRAAGMRTTAAAWGYLGPGLPVEHWGADLVLAEPQALLTLLDLA
jgi:phosphoglycolate phosphatase